MSKKKRGTRRALAGFCLAALSALPGELLLAAEAENASSIKARVIEQSAGVDVQGDGSGPESLGGALYSPFSTAFEAVAQPNSNATPTRQNVDEGTPDLVTTAVATSVAAGFLATLVRVLIAS